MAAPAAAQQQPVSAQVVGNAFVQQYYHILHQSPGLVHRFYQDGSKLGRPGDDGTMSTTTTMDAINVKILSLNYGDFRAEIKSVDAQESLNGGVNVLVTGYLTGKDNVLRNFTQCFFLAPQDKGYFVLNDIFRYMETATINQGGNQGAAEDVEAPVTPEQATETFTVEENHISEPEPVVAEEANGEEVVNPSEDGEVSVVEEEVPVPEVIDEVQVASPVVIESKIKSEDAPKKTFASIVMDLKHSDVPFSSPVSAPRKSQPRSQERQANIAPQIALAVDAAVSGSDAVDISNNQEEEADGYSIYIKGLPMNATPALLEEEFKKFGPIKNGGIQVRSNRGFTFGFVEFEAPDAVQKAIEASPVTINGRNAVVEEKRSTSRGNRGRFPIGRGPGFRNDGGRGRGNYGGGRGYGRGGDFGGGSRTEFGTRVGSRGGSSNRGGGDGYQRVDSNGGRMNRGMAANGTAKNMAPRVPATA